LNINIEELSEQILPVLKRFGVKKAAIFGSLVRGLLLKIMKVAMLSRE
jgi:predicted nucleotidyltransferase